MLIPAIRSQTLSENVSLSVGTLTYDSTMKVDFDDRVLAHLRLVIGMKLRRGESFYLSWRDDNSIGDGSSTIWLNPAIPIAFKFNGSREVAINPRWVESLMNAANSSTGLRPVREPDSDVQREPEE
jgi:hypothetical protein